MKEFVMGFWSFLILVILILAGAWFYRRLQEIEKDLRHEMEADAVATPANQGQQAVVEEDEGPPKGAAADSEDDAGEINPSDLTGRVSALVAAGPGIRQTEFYDHMPDISRKALQDLLRNMERDGLLRREKDRGSYKLYPL